MCHELRCERPSGDLRAKKYLSGKAAGLWSLSRFRSKIFFIFVRSAAWLKERRRAGQRGVFPFPTLFACASDMWHTRRIKPRFEKRNQRLVAICIAGLLKHAEIRVSLP